MATITKRSAPEEMYAMLQACKESGLSNKTYCQQQGISQARFYYWQKKYNEAQAAESTFIPLQVKGPVSANEIEICYPNGVKLKLPHTTDLSVIRMFIGLL